MYFIVEKEYNIKHSVKPELNYHNTKLMHIMVHYPTWIQIDYNMVNYEYYDYTKI